MKGRIDTFSILTIAIACLFAVSLVSLPAFAGVLSGGLIIMDPVDDDFINGNYTMNAIAVGTNLTNITFYYHNGSSGYICDNLTTGTDFTCNWDTSSVVDGMYNLTANDSSGGFLATSYDLTVDNNPPVITLEHPVDSTTYTTTALDLNYTAVDTIAVDSCWGNLNGVIADLPACANTTLIGPEGSNNLVVYANDTSGNIGESSNITFIIDTTGPVLTLLHPEDGENYSEATLDLNYTITDAWSGYDHCWYDLNGVVTDIGCINTTITGVTGDNWLILYGNDTVGNIGQTSNISFLIDDIDPVINWITVGPIIIATNKTFTIEVNATDNIDPNLTAVAELFNTTNYSFGIITLDQSATEIYRLDFLFPDVESGDYRYDVTVTDFVGNDLTVVGAYFEVDNTAPVLSNLLPTGSSSDRYPELEVDTDEISTCRFADANVSYVNMTKTFGSSDGLSHNYGFGKTDYGTYKYYVKCSDALDNVGEGMIEFTVKKSGGGGSSRGPGAYNNNLNATDVTSNSSYVDEEPELETDLTTDSNYETPVEEVIDEAGPTGLFLFPEGSISLTTILMGFVVVFALSSLIFRKEFAEAIDRVRWRHY